MCVLRLHLVLRRRVGCAVPAMRSECAERVHIITERSYSVITQKRSLIEEWVIIVIVSDVIL